MSSEVPTPSQEPTPTPTPQASAHSDAGAGAPTPPVDGETTKPQEETAAPQAQAADPKAGPAAAQAGPAEPKADTAEAKDDTPAVKEKKKKERRWRRRLIGVALVLIAFAVVVRAVIWVALPTVLRKTASFYDLNLDYERLSFSSLDGEVAIWHLTVTPKEGGETIAATDYVHGQISVLNLLRGRLDVWRMEADGVDLAVTRNADGTVPLIEKFVSGSAASKRAAAASGPIDLTPPAAIDAFRLQHVRAHVRDLSVSPPLDTVVALDLRVSDVGSALRPTQFEVNMSSDPVLDNLLVEGEGRASGATLDANIRVRVRGLHGKPAAGYLAPLGIEPVADSIDMKMNGHVTVAGAGQLPATQPSGGSQPTTAPSGPVAPAAPAEALAARLVLDNMGVTADGQEAAAVDHITIVADKLTPGLVDLGSVTIDGVRCGAYRDAAGTLRAAGLQYGATGVTPAQTTSHAPSAAAPAVSQPPAAAPAAQVVPAFKWSLGELAIRNVKATFADEAVSPAGSLAFLVNQLTVKNVVGDPDRPDAELTIAGQFSSPGMARSIRINGAAKPFAAHKTFSLAVRAQGVKPDAIRQYLDLIYVESELKDASFTCDLNGSATVDGGQTTGEARLANVSFDDGRQLLKLNGVAVKGIKLVPERKLYHVDSIEVSGPALSARRDASGEVSGLGLKLDLQRLMHAAPAAPAPAAPAPAARARPFDPDGVAIAATQVPADAVNRATSPPPPAPLLPSIELGRLTWKDIKVSLDDQYVTPHSLITFTDAGFELSDFRFDMNDTKPGQPGKFRAWAAAPTIADQLGIEGTITPGANSTLVDMKVIGRGLSAAIVAPYMKPFGIEPTLKDGSLDLHARAGLKYLDDVLSSTLTLDNIRYAQGDRELAGVDALRVDGLALGKSNAAIDSIEIDRPRISVSRDPDGSFLAAGVRVPFPLPQTPKPPTVTKAPAGETAVLIPVLPTTAPTTGPATGPSTAPTTAPTPFVTVLNKLRVRGASLTWEDQAVHPAAGTTASVDVDLDHFTFGKPADPATLLLKARAGDSLDDLTVTGNVSASADSATAKLEVKAAGIRAGSLAPYLPSGVVVSLKDGRFHVNVDAAVAMHEKGGASGHLLVDSLDYRDGEAGPLLLKLDSVVARVSRVDLQEDAADKAVAVDEISVTGLETAAEKAPDGSLRLLGLALGGPPPAPATQPGPATQPASETQPAKAPTTRPIATVAVPTAPINAADVVAMSHKALPFITVEKLDLNVAKASFTDTSRPASAPLVVSDLRLRNLSRIEMLGRSPASRPPVKLELTCKADPVVGGIKVETQIAPFAEQPTLQVDLSADGIKGEGLTALVPELKDQIDGSGMTDGRFKAKFEAQAKVDRRTPLDFDPQRPFELDFDLTNVEFRAADNGPVLAGVEEVRTEAARIRPATGDVLVHLLEITKPTAQVLRDKQGIRAAGLLYKMPAPGTETTQPATHPAVASSEPAPPPAARPTAVAKAQPGPSTKPTGEVRIDKITISGLDVLVEDQSVDPPFVMPLTGMEVEVLGLSNMDLYENKPIRFDATVNAGKVKLPRKNGSGTEDRDLFAQVAANGKLSLYPDPEGYAKANVSGFELASLTGEAKQFNMKLSGGTFDEAVDVRFKGGSMDAQTKTVITDLAYEEPSNGPLFKLFHLGAPIDTVIGLVQDADGSITLPVDVPVKKGHLETGAVIGSATGAVGLVLATAIASAPLKAASAVTNILPLGGLFGGDKKKEPEQPIVLAFPPGSTSLEPAAAAKLTAIFKRLHDQKGLEIQLKQELGSADVDRARLRANPTREETSALIYRLHQRKLELQRLRGQVAGRARGFFASRADTEAASTVSQLHSIDRELAQTEDALDKLYELLRPGADRQAERRTRAASLDVAWARLDAVKAQLDASGVPDIDKRIEKYNAQFNPAGTEGGTVTLTLVPTKK
jgi:hypothetical protein